MREHYDMTQNVSLDKYNEALCELDEKDNKISELEEDIEYYKEIVSIKNNLIKELYLDTKRRDKELRDLKEKYEKIINKDI